VKDGRRFTMTSVDRSTNLGDDSNRKVKRLKLNNSIRGYLRTLIAGLGLYSDKPAERLAAIEALIDKPESIEQNTIDSLLENEQDDTVLAALKQLTTRKQLSSDNSAVRLVAVNALRSDLSAESRAAIVRVESSDDDDTVRQAALTVRLHHEQQVKLFGWLDTVFFGLSLGSVLVLAAIGLAISFGVMGVINMAHGELIMLGAYCAWAMQQILPQSTTAALLLSVPVAFLFTGLVGVLIERSVIRFLYGRPLETLLATFGISLILQQLVRTFVSPQNVPVANPEFMSGVWQINGVFSLTFNRLYILIFCLLVFAALVVLLKRSRFGLEVRAVSQNRAMARAMGVRSSRLSTLLFVSAVIALLVSVTTLNQLPAGHDLHIGNYMIGLLGKYLTYAILAVAVDLVWGYLGILSLGHAAFFALGGYAMGMYLMRQIGDRGVYGNPDLPDFMVFLNWTELPWYWMGFDSFLFTALMILLVPGLLAFLFGWFAFRSRVNGVYLSIITQALTYALMLAFFRNEMGFGGNNGLTDFKDLLGFDLRSNDVRLGLFIASGIALIAVYLLCDSILRSRLGKVAIAIRDAEDRTRFLGYRVERVKLALFTLSAMIAGLAGALYVPQVGIINPGEFAPLNSIEVVVWVAIGGRGTLYGAVIGALGVNYAKTWFTGAYPEAWLFALGLLFVVVTLLLPKGIAGLRLWKKKPAQDNKESADTPVSKMVENNA